MDIDEDIDEDKEDEEINIDFSKIKNIFKRKKKEGEEVKTEVKEEKEIGREEKIKVEDKGKEETEEDEAEIDFSKITKFFKKKKEEKVEEAKEEIPKTEEDEEIDIDFGKIKSLFKGKKEEKTKIQGKEGLEEKEDEEISIDFSKIKGFFKGLKEKKIEKEGDEEEISLDVRKTIDFFKKYQRFLVPTLLIIIAMGFSFYLRIQPAYLPVTDNWARSAMYNQIRSSIRSQIDQQYPNLPDANKNSLVDAEFNKLLKEQKSQIEQQVEATSNYFKTRLQDDKGHTYTPDIDPYYWMRHARNILNNGHPGDELRDGRPYDNHMYAPVGRYVPPDMFHAYVMAYFYKFIKLFNRDIDFTWAIFYLPIVLSLISIIPAFLIARRLAGNFGGFIAAFIIAIHPTFLSRASGGFSDTDVQNVLFPLLITWLFLEGFESKSRIKIISYAAVTGFLVGLYAFTWGGWFYIFDFILASSIIYIFCFIILNRNDLKNIKEFIKKPSFQNTCFLVLIFILSSALFVSLFVGFDNFRGAFFGGPFAFVTLKQVAVTTVWPNVFTTVAEQNPASLDSVISQMAVGSNLFFLISLIGIALTMLKKKIGSSDIWFIIASVIWFLIILGTKPQSLLLFLGLISIPVVIKLVLIVKDKKEDVNIKEAILLVIWFIATIYAGVKGVRFILLAVPAFAIAISVAFGVGHYYIQNLITKGLHINKNISKILTIALLCILLIGPFKSSKALAINQIPHITEEWYLSLDKIRLEATPDAIINSWWDFGHWFKFVADRAVTFDGTSQSSPNAHWIGSVLLTDDEKYAVGILRMVNCGQNMAFEELDKVIKDEPKSTEIMEEVVRLEKKDAKSVLLKKGLSEEEAENVLKYSHCTPPEDYFITSYDMIGKSGVWAHFGSWDFERALIYNTLKKEEYRNDLEKGISFLQERYNYTREKAEGIYYEIQSIKDDTEANSWIAPWPSYAGSGGCNKIEENKISCGIGQGAQLDVDLKTLQADVQTAQGVKHPNSIVLPLEDGSYRERNFNETIGVSVTLIPSGEDSYEALILSPQLAKSMFTIMFYLNGHGLKYFDKFSDMRDVTGGRIIVWKVNWEGNSTNLLEYYQQKIKAEEELEKKLLEELANKSQEINNSQDINITNNSSE